MEKPLLFWAIFFRFLLPISFFHAPRISLSTPRNKDSGDSPRRLQGGGGKIRRSPLMQPHICNRKKTFFPTCFKLKGKKTVCPVFAILFGKTRFFLVSFNIFLFLSLSSLSRQTFHEFSSINLSPLKTSHLMKQSACYTSCLPPHLVQLLLLWFRFLPFCSIAIVETEVETKRVAFPRILPLR